MTNDEGGKMKTFDSRFTLLSATVTGRSALEIENEPMFFRASHDFASARGGPIMQEFLYKLGRNDIVIDSRVHMLMAGHYPCIPGWHHDDVPRKDTKSNQPDYDAPEYFAKHALCTIDAYDLPTGALPQFMAGSISVPWPTPAGKIVYSIWDKYLRDNPQGGLITPRSGQIVYFDANTFHRGMPAKATGWRYFVRASWDTNLRPMNKVRKNVNVYVLEGKEGW